MRPRWLPVDAVNGIRALSEQMRHQALNFAGGRVVKHDAVGLFACLCLKKGQMSRSVAHSLGKGRGEVPEDERLHGRGLAGVGECG